MSAVPPLFRGCYLAVFSVDVLAEILVFPIGCMALAGGVEKLG
jgi:hypothetical protein